MKVIEPDVKRKIKSVLKEFAQTELFELPCFLRRHEDIRDGRQHRLVVGGKNSGTTLHGFDYDSTNYCLRALGKVTVPLYTSCAS